MAKQNIVPIPFRGYVARDRKKHHANNGGKNNFSRAAVKRDRICNPGLLDEATRTYLAAYPEFATRRRLNGSFYRIGKA